MERVYIIPLRDVKRVPRTIRSPEGGSVGKGIPKKTYES